MGGVVTRAVLAVWSLALLGLAACGGEPQPPAAPPEADGAPVAREIPSWAKVAPEQIAAAKKHGVPVAFENELRMRFVLVPAGTFVMGSRFQERDLEGEETLDESLHRVTLTRPFYVQTTEVTNAQYRRIHPEHEDGAKGVRGPDDHAVGSVSWHDATAFAEALNRKKDPRNYRLPTEAEWEYACRAGTQTRFAFGDTITWEQANFDRLHARAKRSTKRVARHPPNGWGLFDMHGNVSEWCRDWYGYYPRRSRSASLDPQGPSEEEAVVLPEFVDPDAGRRRCRMRVVRGGYWDARPYYVRSAHRSAADPEGFYGGIGFRLVAAIPAE
jgi:formylglycine-generating enzyme required for sulfatase activity